MPEGNIFDFTASRILKFEHKWNTEQKKKAIVDRYKSLGKENKPKIGESILEKSLAKSERSVSAKTAKSTKSTKKDEKGGKDEKGKSGKSKSPSPKKKR